MSFKPSYMQFFAQPHNQAKRTLQNEVVYFESPAAPFSSRREINTPLLRLVSRKEARIKPTKLFANW